MSPLSRRRNALLFVHLAERSAHVVLGFLLAVRVFKDPDLSLDSRTYLLGVFALGVLVASVLGGIVADRGLGYRRAVLGGAALMVLGYVLLSVEGRPMLVAGLVAVGIGEGLSRNSVPVLLGELRAPDDPRRDTDFLLFGFVPVFTSVTTIATAGLGAESHWSVSMLIVGALVGASALVLAWAYPAEPPRAPPPPEGPRGQGKSARVTLLVVLFVAIRVFITGLPMLLGAFVQEHLQRVEGSSRLTIYVVFYLLGFLLPPIMLGVFAVLRARGKRHLVRDKLGLGMLLATASFAVLLLGAALGGDAEQSSLPWILLCHLISSLGMWLMGSMTLSLAVRHLSPRWKATLLGLFFSNDSTAGVLGGAMLVFSAWPSAPGLGLVVAASLGAALLWRWQGRRLVKASRQAR